MPPADLELRPSSIAGRGVFAVSELAEGTAVDGPLNHSCDPNVWFVGDVLVTRRVVAADEELTYDYSTGSTEVTLYLPLRDVPVPAGDRRRRLADPPVAAALRRPLRPVRPAAHRRGPIGSSPCRVPATPTSARPGRSPRRRCGRSPVRTRSSTCRSRTWSRPSTRCAPARADFAVVAIENSVEGAVTVVLDTLSAGDLMMVREIVVPVSFSLAARDAVPLPDVRRVAAHPHAWAQCRRWLAANLPDAVHVPETSNTVAAQLLADPNRAADFDAALVPPSALTHYPLTVLVDQVADNAAAVTRFVVVGHPGELPAPTGADKTVARRAPARQRGRRAVDDARAVRHARGQPVPDRIAPDRRRARPLPVLDRRRRPHRRTTDGRGVDGSASHVPGRAFPRLVPARRTASPTRSGAGRAPATSMRPDGGSPAWISAPANPESVAASAAHGHVRHDKLHEHQRQVADVADRRPVGRLAPGTAERDNDRTEPLRRRRHRIHLERAADEVGVRRTLGRRPGRRCGASSCRASCWACAPDTVTARGPCATRTG